MSREVQLRRLERRFFKKYQVKIKCRVFLKDGKEEIVSIERKEGAFDSQQEAYISGYTDALT